MTDKHATPDKRQQRRQPAPDRARKRAIRAQAASTGVPYSVAARLHDMIMDQAEAAAQVFDLADWAGGETLADQGRTVYPASTDTHRHWLIEARTRRSAAERVQDARRAADLPAGRAQHLVDRFPPTRGEEGTGVAMLYHGEGRQHALALLYCLVGHERPDLVPSAGDLAWEAELGEETAVDTACAELDRAARLLLDSDRASLRPRIADALSAGQVHRDWRVREGAIRLAAGQTFGDTPTTGLPWDGVRQILDAVLVVGDDGHAPGTRVRMLAQPHSGHNATIVGAIWGRVGPPSRYEVCPDAAPPAFLADPRDLVVLVQRAPF
jgi:hypothetical protein